MQTGNKSYLWVQCNLSSKMTKDLKTHMLQHDVKKPHDCNQWGYSTISFSKLKHTQAGSQWRKPFVCTQCSYSCTTAGSLKRHMLKHSGEKPFSCKQCKFSCTRTGALKTHMLTHSGEKPFGCTQCNYSSAQTGNLKTHLLSHSRWRRQILNGKVTSQFPFEICAGSFFTYFLHCVVKFCLWRNY